MRMPRVALAIACAASFLLSGCGLAGLVGAAPPQAPAQATAISRAAIDFSLNAFDAALYGLDFAMDSGKIQPGSAKAKQIAAVGRKVMNFLGAAEAAQKLGNSATYEEAFKNAGAALNEFRSLIGIAPSALEGFARPPMSWAQRRAILDRLDRGEVRA